MEQKTHKLVFSIHVANELAKKGFRITEVKPSRKYKGYAVFIFENTPEFMKEFVRITQEIKSSKQ